MEEERRLAYVGITRAQQKLFLATPGADSCSAPPTTTRRRGSSTRSLPTGRAVGAVSGRTTYGRQSYRSRDEWSNPPPYRARRPRRRRRGRPRIASGWSTPPSPPVATKRAHAVELAGSGLRVGDDVEHPAFGEGVIIEIRGRATRPRPPSASARPAPSTSRSRGRRSRSCNDAW